MKLLLFIPLFCLSFLTYGQTEDERIYNDFTQTKEIVQSNQFKILFRIATPVSGVNINIDSAWIVVNDSIASGYLPYYSGGYGFPMTGYKGINFDNMMLERTVKTKGRNVRKSIKYSFDVIGKNDNYRLRMDIQYDRTCYLYIISKQRSPIAYIGTIYRL